MKRRDVNQIAFDTLQQALGLATRIEPGTNKEAAELGRRGGHKGGKARKKALTSAKRGEIAKKAADARWKTKTS